MIQLQVLNAGGCGVSVVSGLYGAPDKMTDTTGGHYLSGEFKKLVLEGHKKIWKTYPNGKFPGACVIFADTADNNGEKIYKALLAEGEIVDKLECGLNPTHGPSKICVYFWYTTPEGRALHPKATIRKIELGQEEETAGGSVTRARVRKLRAASGEGVRTGVRGVRPAIRRVAKR